MGEEFISKKELLERYGISYGALYRWKRKGLIPEDWFLKKATVTGQETFFPKELICERVELIQSQKDDFSLDELSKQFHAESEAKAVLTVKTLYGDKTFYVSEIQQVLLDDGKILLKTDCSSHPQKNGLRVFRGGLLESRKSVALPGCAFQTPAMTENDRNQLKRALLLATPKERIEKGFHEIYLHNGIRISIFSGDKTKENEEIMVFRKYVLKELTFEKMAELGTIPAGSVELFKTMVKLGFNVLFTGQVRAGKTSFMQCWQRYEDTSLEGMAIATDPETPWHEIMPQAPIMQVIADGKDLQTISKALLRGDNDYVLLEEMRDAYAYKLAMDITSIGTRRSKGTIHAGDALDIPYKMASAIIAEFGGDYKGILSQIFKNWNYVFEFHQEPQNRGQKRLVRICEYRYDVERDRVSIHTICKYEPLDRKWYWKWDIGEDKVKMGVLQPEEFKKKRGIIKMMENRNPIMENTVVYPRYYKSDGDDKDVR